MSRQLYNLRLFERDDLLKFHDEQRHHYELVLKLVSHHFVISLQSICHQMSHDNILIRDCAHTELLLFQSRYNLDLSRYLDQHMIIMCEVQSILEAHHLNAGSASAFEQVDLGNSPCGANSVSGKRLKILTSSDDNLPYFGNGNYHIGTHDLFCDVVLIRLLLVLQEAENLSIISKLPFFDGSSLNNKVY